MSVALSLHPFRTSLLTICVYYTTDSVDVAGASPCLVCSLFFYVYVLYLQVLGFHRLFNHSSGHISVFLSSFYPRSIVKLSLQSVVRHPIKFPNDTSWFLPISSIVSICMMSSFVSFPTVIHQDFFAKDLRISVDKFSFIDLYP